LTCGGDATQNLGATNAYYFEPRSSKEEVLTTAAIQRYGKAAAPIVIEAWRQFSEAFLQYPFGNRSLDIGLTYIMPAQHGPANLLRIQPTGYRASMILFPHDDFRAWCGDYPPETVQKQFAKIAALWENGLTTFRRALPDVVAHKKRFAELDLAIAYTCYHHFQSTANQLEFYMLRE